MTDAENKLLRLLPRLLLAGLVLFELLNQFGILHYVLDFTWFGLAVTSIVAWLVLETASYLLKKSCGQAMNFWAIMLAVGVIYVDALGDILHFYSRFGWYDQMAHFVAGIAIAGLVFNVIWHLCQCKKISMGWLGINFITITITSFISALYEIEEYLEDFFTGSHRLGDGPDTANDLMLAILGTIVIVLIINIFLVVLKNSKSAECEAVSPEGSILNPKQ